MEYFEPPNVAGWKAYYQEPVYYQNWINSVTLPYRMFMTDVLTMSGIQVMGQRSQVDGIALAKKIQYNTDPNALIDGFVELLFPQPITDGQKTFLKNVLIFGLPDFEWTVEWGDYLADPTNEDLEASVQLKLRTLLKTMFNMPEYFLS